MAKITVGESRPETPAEARLRAFFDTQEKENLAGLEAGARQIITLVSAFYGVIFGVLALGKDKMEASLQIRSVVVAGGAAIFALLVAVIAALVVVLPLWGYAADPRKPAAQLAAYKRMLARKVWGLRVAVVTFAVGLAAFAWLVGGVLWYR